MGLICIKRPPIYQQEQQQNYIIEKSSSSSTSTSTSTSTSLSLSNQQQINKKTIKLISCPILSSSNQKLITPKIQIDKIKWQKTIEQENLFRRVVSKIGLHTLKQQQQQQQQQKEKSRKSIIINDNNNNNNNNNCDRELLLLKLNKINLKINSTSTTKTKTTTLLGLPISDPEIPKTRDTGQFFCGIDNRY